MTKILWLLVGALLLALPNPSAAKDTTLLVIVHAQNPAQKLTELDLRRIFQKEVTSWPSGVAIIPLNMPAASDARVTFDKSVLGMDPQAAARFWVDERIRGHGQPPRQCPSVAMAVAVVGKLAGAIAYVPEQPLSSNVKVIAKIKGGEVKPP